MNQPMRPPLASIVPENAPFTLSFFTSPRLRGEVDLRARCASKAGEGASMFAQNGTAPSPGSFRSPPSPRQRGEGRTAEPAA